MTAPHGKRPTPLGHIIQDDIAQLVRPDRLPDGFDWDNIQDVAEMLGRAWLLGFQYAKHMYTESDL